MRLNRIPGGGGGGGDCAQLQMVLGLQGARKYRLRSVEVQQFCYCLSTYTLLPSMHVHAACLNQHLPPPDRWLVL